MRDALREAFADEKNKNKNKNCDELACIRGVAKGFGTYLVLSSSIVSEKGVHFLQAKIEDVSSGSQLSEANDVCEQCSIKAVGAKFMALAAKLVGSEAPHNMVFVKGGCFQMGDTFGDGGADEKSVHEVCVSNFYMGKHEVTQGEWEKVMGSNPSKFKNGSNYPVEKVSWDDVQVFMKKLNAGSGKRYRLPTEAEWEYGARSGGKKLKYGTKSGNLNRSEANYGTEVCCDGDSSDGYLNTSPVGSFPPNGLGLYDMTGNVWEWCSDWYGSEYYGNSPRNNPKGPSGGSDRVDRGGGWNRNPGGVRAANRYGSSPGDRGSGLGFRLALSPGQ